MAEYTPGPWKADSNPRCIRGCRDVARVWGRFDDPEADANALLIIAAPDLYEALHDLLDGVDHFPDLFARERRGDAELTRARAALAKADGRKVSP